MVKVTLDADTFRALASTTRLTVLRALDERRKTLTELARDLALNKATVHEHLQLLTAADLVRKRDDEGRKWIYYELTWRGQKLLHPQETTTFNVLLGLGVLSAGGGVAMLGRALGWWLDEHPLLSPAHEAPAPGPDGKAGISAETANTSSQSAAAPAATSSAPASSTTAPSSGTASATSSQAPPGGATSSSAPTTQAGTSGADASIVAHDVAGSGSSATAHAPAPKEHSIFSDDGWVGLALLVASAIVVGLALFLRRRLRPGPPVPPEEP